MTIQPDTLMAYFDVNETRESGYIGGMLVIDARGMRISQHLAFDT